MASECYFWIISPDRQPCFELIFFTIVQEGGGGEAGTISWVYIIFVNGRFYLWEYIWVVTSLCGGFGGAPLRKFRNMKCSRSDSRPMLSLLRVSS